MRHEVGGVKAWIVCLSAGLFFFYEFFQLNLFDVLNPILRTQFSLSASSLSFLSSAFLWANLIFLIPAGFLLDHFSIKRMLLLSLWGCLLGTTMILLGNRFEVIFLGRFLTGIGNAFCFLACVILVSRWFEHEKQGLLIGLVVTMAFLGGILAHTPFAHLVKRLGWHGAMWVDVGLGLVLGLWIYMSIEDAPDGWMKQVRGQPLRLRQTFLDVLSCRQIYLAGLYTALLNLPIMVMCALWGASYLEVVHGISAMEATEVVSCLFLGSMLGCPVLGWLSDKQRQRKPVMWLGILGSMFSFIPLGLCDMHTVGFLCVIFFSLGFFSSAQVISYPLLAESSRPTQVGEATSVASLIIVGGGAVGQLLFAGLMQIRAGMQTLNYSAAHFQFAFSMFPVAVGIAAIALKMIKETHCQQQSV